MTRLRHIDIDGKRYLWRDILEMRRAQKTAHAATLQLALFELRHDCRPEAARTSAGRYLEPSLFDGSGRAVIRAFEEGVPQLRAPSSPPNKTTFLSPQGEEERASSDPAQGPGRGR